MVGFKYEKRKKRKKKIKEKKKKKRKSNPCCVELIILSRYHLQRSIPLHESNLIIFQSLPPHVIFLPFLAKKGTELFCLVL